MSDLKKTFAGPEKPSPETRMGASALDVLVAVVLSPLVLAWFVVTLLGHGLGIKRRGTPAPRP